MSSEHPKARFFNRYTPPHIATLVLMPALGSISLNIFVASIPEMASEFQVSFQVMQFAISGYLALTALVQIIIGPITDRYGRRPVMLITALIFIVATMMATISSDIYIFMIARVFQAAIVSGLVISRTVVRDLFTREKAASMLGYVTMAMSVAPMLAPPIGGLLAESFGWRSNFYFLAIGGILLLVFCYFDQGETNPNKNSNFKKQFLAYPELLKSKRFWGYSLTAAFSTSVYFAFLGGAAFVGKHTYDLSPSEIGLYMIFTPIGYFSGNFISGRYSVKIGLQRMIFGGIIFTLLGMIMAYVLITAGWNDPIVFFALSGFIGFGNGMTLPNANAGMLDVKPNLAGSAAGLGGGVATLGGAVFATLAALTLTTDNGVIPLVLCMLLAIILSAFAAIFTIIVEEKNRKAQS
ncbi:MAG: Bcr/CflA family drug resistance efflux transporter [Rhodobacteraceae bacterium]|nr:MAG: Bcr/CflA family drug resistance efflux transporter [Paracoccaceae bacterium]